MSNSSQIASDKTITQATDYLSQHDPLLAKVIAASPACDIRPHKNYYQELVDSIISQQLSVKAARTIEKRFVNCSAAATSQAPSKSLPKISKNYAVPGSADPKQPISATWLSM